LTFVVAILGTNAGIEKVISFTNILQTGEKNRFLFETIKAGTRTHFRDLECNEFYILVSNNPRLLHQIPSPQMPQKCETSAQQEKPTT
jgi:hypothetical protein